MSISQEQIDEALGAVLTSYQNDDSPDNKYKEVFTNIYKLNNRDNYPFRIFGG